MVVLYNKKILTVQCALLSDKKIKQATAEKNTKLCKTRLIGFFLDSKHLKHFPRWNVHIEIVQTVRRLKL